MHGMCHWVLNLLYPTALQDIELLQTIPPDFGLGGIFFAQILTFKPHFVSIKPMEKDENKIYEVAFNAVPTLSEEALASEFSNIKDALSKLGGSVIAEAYPKTINLAYTMNKVISNKNNKFSTAHFGWIKFEMPASAVEEFKKLMDRDDNIIRSMIISTVRESTLAPKKTFSRENGKRRSSADDAKAEDMDKEAVDKKLEEITVAA
jgi:ribosomal protein S6